eukprot:GHVU01111322.1.p1 GENE.GHVU01111322.1~~GHVU01111322.1.p1  ORF type:complete len:393 (+),score=43.98 GHVU01111322.1:39-1217(+)
MAGVGPSFFASMLNSCTGSLRDLTINVRRGKSFSEYEAAIRGTKFHLNLERLTMRGNGARWCFAAMSESVASSLLVLWLCDDDMSLGREEFYGPIEGNFEKLEKLEMGGIGSGRCFASMLRSSCPESLIELSLKDNNRGAELPQFPERFEGCFRKLRKLELEGPFAARWFESISEWCASSLLELKLMDWSHYFPETLKGNFTKLEKLTMRGVGAARCFASMSASCSHSLLELDLRVSVNYVDEEYGGFRKGLGGNLVKLEKLRLDGHGASQCFASMSVSCSHSLLELDLRESIYDIGEEYGGFPKGLGGDLVKLEKLRLIGSGASQWFASVSESLAPSLVDVRIYQWHTNFVDAIPGEFLKLKFLTLGGTKNARRIFEQMNVDHDSVKFSLT